MKRETFILDDIICLPEDVVYYVIKEYIPYEYLVFTNKYYYNKFHKRLTIPQYEQYAIRRNHSFVFETIMRDNIYNWLQRKPYFYKHTQYSNYIYFIIDYCNEHEAVNCRKSIVDYLRELGLCQNQHKKNVRRSIV